MLALHKRVAQQARAARAASGSTRARPVHHTAQARMSSWKEPALFAPVDVVAKKEVVGLWWQPVRAQDAHERVQVSVDVANADNWHGQAAPQRRLRCERLSVQDTCTLSPADDFGICSVPHLLWNSGSF
jgi:hypothetical protein